MRRNDTMIKKFVLLVGSYCIIDFICDKLEDAIDWAYEKGFESGYDCGKKEMPYKEAYEKYCNSVKRKNK